MQSIQLVVLSLPVDLIAPITCTTELMTSSKTVFMLVPILHFLYFICCLSNGRKNTQISFLPIHPDFGRNFSFVGNLKRNVAKILFVLHPGVKGHGVAYTTIKSDLQ